MKVQYEDDMKIAYYNGERFTRDDRTGYYLSARRVPELNKRVRLHIYVWTIERGAIPKGYQVHHIDEDKRHNDIDNLTCISRHNHLSYHSKKKYERNPEVLDGALELAREAAKEWHASEAGHKWHKEHYEQNKAKLHMVREFKCEYCGKLFKSTQVHSRFCCNAHKTAYRVRSGVDNEERTCAVCGKTFLANKYARKSTCGIVCKGKLRSLNNKRALEA